MSIDLFAKTWQQFIAAPLETSCVCVLINLMLTSPIMEINSGILETVVSQAILTTAAAWSWFSFPIHGVKTWTSQNEPAQVSIHLLIFVSQFSPNSLISSHSPNRLMGDSVQGVFAAFILWELDTKPSISLYYHRCKQLSSVPVMVQLYDSLQPPLTEVRAAELQTHATFTAASPWWFYVTSIWPTALCCTSVEAEGLAAAGRLLHG